MNDWVIVAGDGRACWWCWRLFTGTFYLLMIAIGLGFGALAALVGMSVPMQTIVAAVVGVVATGVLHRSRFGHPARHSPARDPNVNIDIGQRLDVDDWQDGKARVMYRGALWDVELGQGAIAGSGQLQDRRSAGQPPDRRKHIIITTERGSTWNYFGSVATGPVHRRAGIRIQDHQRGAAAARMGGRTPRQIPCDAGAGPEHRDPVHRPHRLQALAQGDPARRAAAGLHHARQHPAAGRRHPVLPDHRRDARLVRLVELPGRPSPSWRRPRCVR